MKVTNLQPPFSPIRFEIKIESAEEARALYAICNHSDNVDLLPGLRDIKESCLEGHAVYGHDSIIANNITYGKWYK